MITKSPQEIIKYVRSPLGFVLAVMVILGIVVSVVLFTELPITVKLIMMGLFLAIVIGVLVWVIRRTAREPYGLVATEDYYALETYLKHLKAYGTEEQVETKEQILKRKRVPKGMLPEPKQQKLINGESQ